jgi:hypothetical protein
MEKKAFRCKHCEDEKVVDADTITPECCGEPMMQVPLESCSKPFNSESARPFEDEDACDDGVH